jgi:uncharacterized protein YmfQ (DUF2313 family)
VIDDKQTYAALIRSLLPEGRAYNPQKGGVFDGLIEGVAEVFGDTYRRAREIQDSQIPDNPGFDEGDATRWEIMLGLLLSNTATLSEREQGILRKMRAPGEKKGRSSKLYLQEQLELAGFDTLTVYENRFWDGNNIVSIPPPETYEASLTMDMQNPSVNPIEQMDDPGINPLTITGSMMGRLEDEGRQKIIANSFFPDGTDATYEYGDASNLPHIFFIGGAPFPNTADVPATKELALRQLVASIKPAHLAAYLGINYT